MTLQRMDNVLIVVDNLEAVKAFFIEISKELGPHRRRWDEACRQTSETWVSKQRLTGV